MSSAETSLGRGTSRCNGIDYVRALSEMSEMSCQATPSYTNLSPLSLFFPVPVSRA